MIVIWIAISVLWNRLLINLITTREVEQITKSLKTKSSYGYDEMSTKIIKISGPFISSPLSYICNKMLFGGYSQID